MSDYVVASQTRPNQMTSTSVGSQTFAQRHTNELLFTLVTAHVTAVVNVLVDLVQTIFKHVTKPNQTHTHGCTAYTSSLSIQHPHWTHSWQRNQPIKFYSYQSPKRGFQHVAYNLLHTS